MRYLLDVNSLVALGFVEHAFHDRTAAWVRSMASKGKPDLATCAITELGFVRVLAQAPQYGFTVAQARSLLLRLKAGRDLKLGFIGDDHDVSHLPAWVKTARQTTDGHLAELARANGAVLATLDERISGAFLIP
jgi:predicted nucleic acid-binding protein